MISVVGCDGDSQADQCDILIEVCPTREEVVSESDRPATEAASERYNTERFENRNNDVKLTLCACTISMHTREWLGLAWLDDDVVPGNHPNLQLLTTRYFLLNHLPDL